MPRRMISRLATIAIKDSLCKENTLISNTACNHANLSNTFKTCIVMNIKLVVLDVGESYLHVTSCFSLSPWLQNRHFDEGLGACLSTIGS